MTEIMPMSDNVRISDAGKEMLSNRAHCKMLSDVDGHHVL